MSLARAEASKCPFPEARRTPTAVIRASNVAATSHDRALGGGTRSLPSLGRAQTPPDRPSRADTQKRQLAGSIGGSLGARRASRRRSGTNLSLLSSGMLRTSSRMPSFQGNEPTSSQRPDKASSGGDARAVKGSRTACLRPPESGGVNQLTLMRTSGARDPDGGSRPSARKPERAAGSPNALTSRPSAFRR